MKILTENHSERKKEGVKLSKLYFKKTSKKSLVFHSELIREEIERAYRAGYNNREKIIVDLMSDNAVLRFNISNKDSAKAQFKKLVSELLNTFTVFPEGTSIDMKLFLKKHKEYLDFLKNY